MISNPSCHSCLMVITGSLCYFFLLFSVLKPAYSKIKAANIFTAASSRLDDNKVAPLMSEARPKTISTIQNTLAKIFPPTDSATLPVF